MIIPVTRKRPVGNIEDVLYIKKIKQFIKRKFIHTDNQGGNDENKKKESN